LCGKKQLPEREASGEYYQFVFKYDKNSAALVSGFTLGITFSIMPFSSITKVDRTTPMLTLP
jgi:hypothetical protein